MVTDIVIHMGLEALGSLSLACALGYCKHTHHRIMVWVSLALPFSILTVLVVG